MVSLSSDERTIRPSWLNSSKLEPPVTLSQGRPRTGSQSRSRPSQPLLASSVPAGWKAVLIPLFVRAFEGRPPDAGRGVPEVDLGIIAQLSPAWCRRGSRRSMRFLRSAAGTTGRAGRSPLQESGRCGFVCSSDRRTAIWAPSGRKARFAGSAGTPGLGRADRSPGRRRRARHRR